jgi:indole-3-glycerol phosphate synthase
VNCRDLKSLKVDFTNFEKLANDLPENIICVAESGLYGSNDINKVIKMGYRAALIGTSLMQSADPQATLQKMKAAASKSI